ncbi:hypothetical protein [Faecalispora anaeroviscerum]|uniref:hypothetical protein n=1 Tax=Faecalispora anaeroviscerum TaxID=2991836 RepID=UPI0024BB1EA2|nr:hypothetical protein [Faecalispora anaeroviscerum]
MSAEVWWVITSLVTLALGVIGYFLKRTVSQTDENEKDIQVIKQTYVTQDDFKEYKDQSRGDIKQITADINELKEKCLFKEDFYRTQANTDAKLDRIYDMLYQMQKGGSDRG